jgi:hypothetical protein
MGEPGTDQDQPTSAQQTEARPRRGGNWLIWLLAAFAIYALSFGPAARYFILASSPPPPKVFNTIYAPLRFLCHKIPAVQTFYDWYIDLWLPEQGPPSPPVSGSSTN